VFARDLHVVLALVSVVAMAGVAVEGAGRAFLRRPPGRFAAATRGAAVVVVGMTMAGGVAMLVRGDRPGELLHFVYSVLALALVPFADSLAAHASPRRRGLARLLGALVALGVIARLFATG
jgi:hypothetical protein